LLYFNHTPTPEPYTLSLHDALPICSRRDRGPPGVIQAGMRVLALDTALDACAAAVLDTEGRDLLASETQPMSRGHAEALMPMVARVMDAARLEFSDIDRIAVTVGPGSFTGVRVGIAAARGIALAAGKPAIGLTTLAAFTAPHVAAGFAGTVVPVIDARHGQVYMQVFGPGGRAVI